MRLRNAAAGQVTKVIKGGAPGVKVQPVDTAKGESPKVTVQTGTAEQTIEIAPNLNKEVPIARDAIHGEDRAILAGLPDQGWEAGERERGAEQPVRAGDDYGPRGAGPGGRRRSGGRRTGRCADGAGAAEARAKNHLTLYVAGDGSLSYELSSRKMGLSSGKLEMNKPLPTGWADWTLVADQYLPAGGGAF